MENRVYYHLFTTRPVVQADKLYEYLETLGGVRDHVHHRGEKYNFGHDHFVYWVEDGQLPNHINREIRKCYPERHGKYQNRRINDEAHLDNVLRYIAQRRCEKEVEEDDQEEVKAMKRELEDAEVGWSKKGKGAHAMPKCFELLNTMEQSNILETWNYLGNPMYYENQYGKKIPVNDLVSMMMTMQYYMPKNTGKNEEIYEVMATEMRYTTDNIIRDMGGVIYRDEVREEILEQEAHQGWGPATHVHGVPIDHVAWGIQEEEPNLGPLIQDVAWPGEEPNLVALGVDEVIEFPN